MTEPDEDLKALREQVAALRKEVAELRATTPRVYVQGADQQPSPSLQPWTAHPMPMPIPPYPYQSSTSDASGFWWESLSSAGGFAPKVIG